MAFGIKRAKKKPAAPAGKETPRTPDGKKKKKRGGLAALRRIGFSVLVTIAVVVVGGVLVLRDQAHVDLGSGAVGYIFAPIHSAVTSATRYVRDVLQGAKNYIKLTEDYELAKREIDNLKLQLQALEEEARENDRLKELLGAKDRYMTMEPLYAQVIGRSNSVWLETFTINRGTRDGVAPDMAVVTGDGLVGRVLEASPTYAKVMSIIDTRSSVSCLIERTRETGVMRGETSGRSDSQECFMYYLPSVNNITPGDTVLTAGDDSLFPKGLRVGTVASISRQTDVSDQYIVVQPFVDFVHIEEVLVLRTFVEEEDKQLAPLPTPTPRPTPQPTPTPDVEEKPAVDPDSEIWSWPSPTPDPDQVVATPQPTPTPTLDPNGPVEDAWAR